MGKMRNSMIKFRLHRIVGFLGLAAAGLVVALAVAYAQDVKPEIRAALNSGDTTTAVDLINKDIQLDPSYNVNYLTLGMIYYQRHQYQRAKAQFLIALDKKKKDYESSYYLSMAYLQLNQLDSAAKVLQEPLDRAKGLDRARFEDAYAQVMLARDSIDAAQRALIEAVRLDSTNSLYMIHLGNSYFKMKVPSLAVSNYERALKTDTGSTEVYYNWAEACLEMQDYNCALEKLRIVLQKDSTHADAWARAGGIYFKAALSTRGEERISRFKEALGSYRKYLDLSKAAPDSANVRPFFETAMCYLNLGGFEDAVTYFEKVLSIPYEPRDIYFNYGKALWGIRNYDKAAEMPQKHLDWIKQQGPDYKPTVTEADVYLFLGDSYFYRKPADFANAVTSYKKSFDADSTNKRVIQNIALSYHQLKSYQQALDFYNKRIALGIDSANCNIYKNAGYCALNLAGNKASDDEMDPGADAAPATKDTTAALSNTELYKAAVGYLEKYIQFSPSDAKVWSLIGNTKMYNLNDCAGGVEALQKALPLDPKDCTIKKSLGYAYFGDTGCGKNYTRALEYLNQAYDCMSNSGGACKDVDLVLWIAQCYHLRAAQKSGDKPAASADFKQAYEWYGKVLKCQPGNKTAKDGQDNTRYEFNK